MTLTRLWFAVCALVAALGLYLAIGASVKHAEREKDLASEQVRLDQRGVQLAMRLDARQRLDLLLRFSGDKSLRDATRSAQLKPGASTAALSALAALSSKVPAEYKFSALFLVDREGRILARTGYEQAAAYPDMELGGYAAVFDALHGFARDDAWTWGRQVFRVVARPIEDEVGAPPLGAIVGLTEIDRVWSRDIARRTGANVVFTSNERGQARTVAFGSASELSEAELDVMSSARHEDSERLMGEAGEGQVVVRCVRFASATAGLASLMYILPTVVLLALLGVGMAAIYLESDKPFARVTSELNRVLDGQGDALALASLSGRFRGLGDLINRTVALLAAKGGGRSTVDLGALVGAPDARAGMSAFSLPDAPSSTSLLPVPVPPPARAMAPPARGTALAAPMLQPQREDEITGVNLAPAAAAVTTLPDDRSVYESFLLLRAQCGEGADSLSFDAFSRVLAKHRADISARYPGSAVAFSVYTKDGRASLRATPVKAAEHLAGKEVRQ